MTERPPRPRGFFRAWTVLLALVLPFALVFANPIQANAATSWSKAYFDFSIRWGTDASCYLPVAAGPTPDTVQWGNGVCRSGVDVTPGWSQPGEAGTPYLITFSGNVSDGGPCIGVGAAGSGTLTDHPDNGTWSTAGGIPAGSGSVGPGPGCVVNSVCLTLYSNAGPDDDSYKECVAVTLLPTSGDPCPRGTVLAADAMLYDVTGTAHQHGWRVTFDEVVEDFQTAGGPGWLVAPLKADSSLDFPGTWMYGSEFYVPSDSPLSWDRWYGTYHQSGVAELPAGIQINGDPNDHSVGVNDPANCRFYFGQKLWDDPTTETDEPAGPLGAPAPGGGGTDEPPPPPDDQDPPADEPGFWGAILKILSSIWKAISSIPGKIGALFMPEQGYLDAKGQQMKDAWEDTAPGQYVDTFKGLSVGSGVSGCGGIAFDPPFPGVEMDTYYIGEACSGKTAQAAQLVRLGISAMVVIGGGLACVRALGSGFGWNPNVGNRGEAS